MRVETVEATETPEEVACRAARGDYWDGFIEDESFETLMEGVSISESAVDYLTEQYHFIEKGEDGEMVSVVDSVDATKAPLIEARKYSLLEDLFRKGHWGPFEHPSITLAIEGISRSCMAQLTRHRHASFDVQSMRYVDFSETDAITPKSLLDEEHFSRETGSTYLSQEMEDLRQLYEEQVSAAMDTYRELVECGVPKEDARFVLPIGTPVNLTVTVNARMLLHIEDMRKKADAQWEIRELTEKVHREFEDWMPMTADLYERFGPHKLAP